MQLYIGEGNGQSATVLMRWCFSKQEIAKLARLDKDKAKVIISVLNEKHQEEARFLLPASVGATYVSFRNSGHHTILAGIADLGCNSIKEYVAINSRQPGYNLYCYDIVDGVYGRIEDRELSIRSDYVLNKGDQAQISVDVEAGLFAKKAKDYSFVNRLWHNPPIDQCDFRKRRLIFYPFLPFWLLWSYASHLALAGTALVCGFREWFTWRSLIHPIKYLGEDVHGFYESYCAVIYSKKGEKKPLYKILLNPRFWPVYGLLVYLLTFITLKFLIIWAIGSFVAVICMIISNMNFGIIKYVCDSWDKWMREAAEEGKRIQKQELSALNCQLVPEKVTFANLPKKTVRLRFDGIKRKVCRPFSGNG